MSLVFVDSESKAKTLSSQCDFKVEGIVVQKTPMVIRHDALINDLHAGKSGFHFVPSESGNKALQMILDNPEQDIIIAFDNDQRGDYWSWMVQGYINSSGNENRVCKRMSTEGLQKDLLKAAMDKAADFPCSNGAVDYIRSLFNSYLVRHLQRLIGTSAGPGNLPLDYTTLTILFLFADRRNMIAPGTSPAGLKLLVKLSSNTGGLKVWLKKGPEVPDNGCITDSAQVKNILAELQGATFVLEAVNKKAASLPMPEPLDFFKLLHDGYCLLGLQPGEIYNSLVELYHGVEIDGIWTGLISDPYGNASEQSGEILDHIRAFLAEEYGENEVEARDCHPKVILPLHPALIGNALHGAVTEQTVHLYELIRSQAMMSQMVAPLGDELEVDVKAGDFVFSCRGVHVRKPGFLQENSQNEYDELQLLSTEFQEGHSFEVVEMVPQTVGNLSADQYTFLSLLDGLDDFSISLSSRLPNILQQMVEGQYIRMLTDGTLLCLENTKKVVNTVNRAFPKMQDIHLSAYFEQTVMEVISGRKNIDFALKQFEQNLQMQGISLVKKAVSSPVIPRGKRSKNIIKSPIREESESIHEVAVTKQEEGKITESSENDVALETAQTQDESIETGVGGAADEVCEERPSSVVAEEEDVVEEAFVDAPVKEEEPEEYVAAEQKEEGETGLFEGSEQDEVSEEPPIPSSLPDEVIDEKVQALSDTLETETGEDILCPLCGNEHLREKQTASDKIYYECSVSNCEFIAWSRPHSIFCPQCKSPYLVEKKGTDGATLHCPKAGCRYEQPTAGAEKSVPANKKKKVLVKRKKGSGAAGSKKRKVVVRRKR